MSLIILGLGSNIGDRALQLGRALHVLQPLLAEMQCSPVYESEALQPPEATNQEWDMPFLNFAVSGYCTQPPEMLLKSLKAIENTLGRTERGRWGPREIDIDILAYGDAVMDSMRLTLPHRELLYRDFALLPLADIAPDWRYPAGGPYHGMSAQDIVNALGMKENPRCRRTAIRF